MATVKIKFRVSSIETKAGTLYYQVIHNRLVKQVHFGYKLYPSEWDADCSRVILSSGIEKGQEGYLLSMKPACLFYIVAHPGIDKDRQKVYSRDLYDYTEQLFTFPWRV